MSFFKKNQIAVKREYLLTKNLPFEVRESFRSLKASLCVSLPKKENGEGIALLVTSASPEVGKTTVSVNLSLMLAESNVKVLLIDADTRKGRVARFFETNAKPGLVDCISGQASLDDVTRVYSENLSYITCGSHSPRPYELLESTVTKNLLSQLKKQYDYIIIDTPPVLLLSDALALIPETDGTIVVCRHRSSQVNDIAKTLNTLRFAKANILGVIVNDYTPLEKSKRKHNGYYSHAYATYYQDPEVEAETEAQSKVEVEVEQEAAMTETSVTSVDQKTGTTTEKKSAKLGAWFKNVWAKIKAIPWSAPVKPVVGWSVAGGALLLSVVLMLIFWL